MVREKSAPFIVWVPPGASVLASEEVQVQSMAPAEQPGQPAPPAAPEAPRSRPGSSAGALRHEEVPTGRWGARPSLPVARGGGRRPDPGWVYRPGMPAPVSARVGLEPDVESELAYVTPELLSLADEVMSQYDMKVSGMRFITAKPDKGGAIWRIETDYGPRSLKQLHRAAARSLFSVAAQDYLVQRGARVPALVRSKEKELYVERNGKLWIVTDWVEPLYPVSKIDLEGAAALCHGLGEFHRQSEGYVPPMGAQKASRLYRWPKTYAKVITKMGWLRTIGEAYREMPASNTLVGVVEVFEQQARDAYDRLTKSPYASLIARGEPAWGLAHQDYGWSNGQMGKGGIWIIDLDGVAYDLPIRDLRKLITSTMDDRGVWDVAWMRGMIEAYHQANPIEPDLFQVLLIDMALPNEFYKNVKEAVMDPLALGVEMDALMRRLAETDRTKWGALAELSEWGGQRR